MSAADLKPRLRGNRQLKAALLDQENNSRHWKYFMPMRHCSSLVCIHAARLAAWMLGIARGCLRPYRMCCSAQLPNAAVRFGDYKDADGNAGAFQNSFKQVYGKGGEACPACGAALQKSRVGAVLLYFVGLPKISFQFLFPIFPDWAGCEVRHLAKCRCGCVHDRQYYKAARHSSQPRSAASFPDRHSDCGTRRPLQ